jgi:hypothetical protein
MQTNSITYPLSFSLCTDLHLTEVMKLHSCGEVKQHVCQVWAFVGELMQYSVCDELYWQFNVAQTGTKPNTGTRAQNANIRTVCSLKIQQNVSSLVTVHRYSRVSL